MRIHDPVIEWLLFWNKGIEAGVLNFIISCNSWLVFLFLLILFFIFHFPLMVSSALCKLCFCFLFQVTVFVTLLLKIGTVWVDFLKTTLNFRWQYETTYTGVLSLKLLQMKLLPVNIYLYKVNNRNTRKRCKTCLKLTIKTPERR